MESHGEIFAPYECAYSFQFLWHLDKRVEHSCICLSETAEFHPTDFCLRNKAQIVTPMTDGAALYTEKRTWSITKLLLIIIVCLFLHSIRPFSCASYPHRCVFIFKEATFYNYKCASFNRLRFGRYVCIGRAVLSPATRSAGVTRRVSQSFSRVRESVILLLHAKQGEVNGKEKGLACDIGAPLRRMPNGWHQVKGADEMTSTVNPPQCPWTKFDIVWLGMLKRKRKFSDGDYNV